MTQIPPISAEGFRTDWSGLRNLLDSSIATIEKQTTFEMRSAHLDELARVLEAGIAASIPASRGAETEGLLARAYLRGVEWRDENSGHVDYSYRFKAACDYADKTYHSLAALPAPLPVEEQEELIGRLRAACVGHPHAVIEWPHRLLHDAIAALEALSPNLALLRSAATELRRLHSVHCPHYEGKIGEPDLSIADRIDAALNPPVKP